jgi:Cd2+/Zn2+-exporting ATPase
MDTRENMQDTKIEHQKDNNHNEKSCSCCAVDFFEEKLPLWKQKKIITGSISAILLTLGLILEFLTPLNIIAQIIFLSVVIVAGKDILKKAWLSISRWRLDMNCLMSIAAFGAFLIGHGEEGAAVIFLFFIAESLEDYAADRAKNSISQLLKLAPDTARVKRADKEIELHVHEIEIGDIVVVRPGEKVPLDGKVEVGQSSANQASITGESIPVEKTVGDEVYAGTINEEGYLEIKVTKKSDETILSKIVKMVEEAERKKSNTEKFIDKFARIYTPAVITMAFATFLIPVFILGLSWDVWFYRALVLLVVSCPCALAISTPVAMVSAITSAARNGVLIKGATFIEEMKKIKVLAFDKTGTLSKGKLEVTDIIGFNNYSQKDVLSIAASLEARSEHPIAKAIFKKAHKEGIKLKEISNFKSIKGKGLETEIDGKHYYAGARQLFDSLSLELPPELSRIETEGKTSILIANEDKAIGVIALGDKIRDNAPEVISNLKKLNIRTKMITGDNERVAHALSEKIGIDEYHAELLPEDKVRIIEELKRRFGSVAMVGDGVNDAPALAVANVGIVMGTIGSDVAIETADIALMHDDLSKINYLTSLSRQTMNVVKQNITAAILIKGSFAIGAVFGLINLWVAVGAGDMGLSLAVILNAIRLTKMKA